MDTNTERLKILNEMNELQNRLNFLNKTETLNLKRTNSEYVSSENIDLVFGLAHLHESNYENYVFLEKFIEITKQLQDIRIALAEHKIYSKDEPFFKNENDRKLLDKWVQMKHSEIDFKNCNLSEEELNNKYALLELDIEKNKRKMDEVIAE